MRRCCCAACASTRRSRARLLPAQHGPHAARAGPPARGCVGELRASARRVEERAGRVLWARAVGASGGAWAHAGAVAAQYRWDRNCATTPPRVCRLVGTVLCVQRAPVELPGERQGSMQANLSSYSRPSNTFQVTVSLMLALLIETGRPMVVLYLRGLRPGEIPSDATTRRLPWPSSSSLRTWQKASHPPCLPPAPWYRTRGGETSERLTSNASAT